MAEWTIAGYTDLKALGSGGFGDVMLARHDPSGAMVAIKYLHHDLLADPQFAAMFRGEAAVLAALDDPNVVRLYEYVESPAGAAIVMELVDGVCLREILSRQGATTAEAALVDPVPGPLRPLVTAGMAKDPADRPADAGAFVRELRTVAADAFGQDWEDRGRSRLAEAALLLAALWPSGAPPATHATAVRQIRLPRSDQGSRESRHLWHLRHLRHEAHLRHLRRLRAAMAAAAAVAVAAAVVVVVVTSRSSHAPAGASAGSSPSAGRSSSPARTPPPVPANWQSVRTLTDPTTGGIQAMAASPTGGLLATGSIDGSSYLWNMTSGQLVATITQASSDGVSSLAFSPDGATLAIGFGSGTIVLWDVATMQTLATLSDGYGQGGVSSLAFSPDGATLAAADLGGRGTFLWDVATGHQLALLSARLGSNTAAAFSPDGKVLATGWDGGTVLWDVATGTQIARFGITGSGPIISVAFSPDGSVLATGGFSGAVLWDVATGRRIAVLPNAVVSADTTTVAFSPDGTFLVTAGAHTPLWATATGTKITTISVTSGVVAFGPQGQMLATAFDNRVAVWAPAHG
jgi:WD40 repeat protein